MLPAITWAIAWFSCLTINEHLGVYFWVHGRDLTRFLPEAQLVSKAQGICLVVIFKICGGLRFVSFMCDTKLLNVSSWPKQHHCASLRSIVWMCYAVAVWPGAN